jgi:hypothetical protein
LKHGTQEPSALRGQAENFAYCGSDARAWRPSLPQLSCAYRGREETNSNRFFSRKNGFSRSAYETDASTIVKASAMSSRKPSNQARPFGQGTTFHVIAIASMW